MHEIQTETPARQSHAVKKVSESIEDIMQRWASWRVYRAGDELGYGECITGKLLDGMPKIACTYCIRGEQSITIKGNTIKMRCTACAGTQWMAPKISGVKVNPKLIRSTGGKYPDELSSRVDRLVCALNLIQQSVVFAEYVYLGTRDLKRQKIGVGRRVYEVALSTSHDLIQRGLSSTG